MSWEKVRLGDVVSKIIGGGTPSKKITDFWNGNIPWCSVKDMADDKYSLYSTTDFISEKGLKNSSANLISENTVIIATRMGLGRAFINKSKMAINQDLKALIPNSNIENEYLLWSLVSKREELLSLGSGATVKGITLDVLKEVKIPLPPLPVQKRIADILSTYDNLIENNLQRIKHLEAMAKCEYKMLMKESEVEVRKLSDIASVNSNAIPSKFNGSIQYIDIASVSTGCINELQEFDFKDAPSRAKRIVKDGDIIWSCVRPNRKSFALIQAPSINTIASTGFAVITPSKVPSSFLYQALTTDEFVKYLESHAQGSAYPAVSAKDFENSFIEVPIKVQSLTWFEQSVSKYFKQKHNLESQNTHLRQIRDTLLPKLMSGQIVV